MIRDHEMELTTPAAAGYGELFAHGTEYGSKPYDMKLNGGSDGQDVAIGEPLDCFYMVEGAANSIITSVTISLVADTDGAGTSAVTLLTTSALVLASLTLALGVVRLGTVPAKLITSTLRYLTLKVVCNGTGSLYLKAWLAKGTDHAPANSANII